MKNFRSLELAKSFYNDCQTLKLKQPLKDQFSRAVLSIPLNLSEGTAKPTAADRKCYYARALGSLREVQTILELAGDQTLQSKADHLGAVLYKLVKAMN